MKLPFSLPEDKERRDYWSFRSYEIVSLRQLFQFHAAQFVRLSNLLGQLYILLRDLRNKNPQANLDLNSCVPQLQFTLSEAFADIVQMKLDVSEIHASALLMMLTKKDAIKGGDGSFQFVNAKVAIDDAKQTIAELAGSLEIELRKQVCLRVSLKRAEYYRIDGTFLGEEVLKRFRSIEKDAEEAGNCFALGRYTACVFHLMRIMEVPVQRLGKRFRINLHKATWGKILGELSPIFNRMDESTPRLQRRKAKYNHCLNSLNAICRGLRNPISHPMTYIEVFYDEGEANNIMKQIKGFLEEFAKLR